MKDINAIIAIDGARIYQILPRVEWNPDSVQPHFGTANFGTERGNVLAACVLLLQAEGIFCDDRHITVLDVMQTDRCVALRCMRLRPIGSGEEDVASETPRRRRT